MSTLIDVPSPAKINLSLAVIDQRVDGYHELESIITFADIADTITASAADTLSLTVEGPFEDRVPIEGNLILRAAKLLQQASGTHKGASLHLRKTIPVEAGLGGGSSNAAITLRLLLELWGLKLDDDVMSDIALSLGADVPVCYVGVPALIRGIGETITPVKALPSFSMVLVNPMVPLSTVNVFKRGFARFSESSLEQMPEKEKDWLPFLLKGENDLEANAKSLVPEIWQVLDMLRSFEGCELARMSGSGATCFAIFSSDALAQEAATQLAEESPGWWVQACKSRGSE